MFGAAINGMAILLAGFIALATPALPGAARQEQIRVVLGILTVYAGLSATWKGLAGSFRQVVGHFLIMMAALILGRLLGRLLRLQRGLNRLGRFAKLQMESKGETVRREAFAACTVLFCLAPLSFLSPVCEGLRDDLKPFFIKSALDALAMLSLVRMLGPSALLAAVPVFVGQGTLALGVKTALPFLEAHALADPVYATAGMLVFAVSLMILQIRRVEFADYLPSLLIAPALSWAFH